MTQVNLPSSATPTQLCPGGRAVPFIHVFNNGAATIYVCYDSDDATALANLATTNGVPIPAGESIMLNNDGMRELFTRPVYGVQQSGGAIDVRLQGV